MRTILFISIICLVAICNGHRNFPKRNNYLQYLRSQTFMQEKAKNKKLNENYSEDINEFDEYEADESEWVKDDEKRGKGIQRKGSIYNTRENDDDRKDENKLVFKNIEKELNGIEVLNDERKVNLTGGGRECSVNEKGTLDVSINSSDIFNLNKYMVEITSSSILIKELNNDKVVVKDLPFKHIKLPIETIEETRECWNIKLIKEKIIFCEKKKEDRDRWITNILKALFCYNSNNLTIEEWNKDINTKIDIPKESTVDKRIQSLKKKNSGDDNSPKYVKQPSNNNIVISDIKNDKPKIEFN
ncbi:conserved Plasmodium protein, unknown function [Plasmodium malariae]|uniref:Crystalloid-specific PH domain-containing protein n=1 Tax=Plasmodium malariae TaxID=5858 RepID=A0A1C3KLL0_PLAMA|nr:conserved Plasmodium protein, unknown function [Plasmodium malariae]